MCAGIRYPVVRKHIEKRMTKLISQITSPTALPYVFVVITQVIAGIYLSGDIELPPTYSLLYPLGFLWIIGWWLQRDSRKHGVAWVYDMGLFLYVAWPFIMLYYLFKTRGVHALLTILVFATICVVAYVMGVAIQVLLTH